MTSFASPVDMVERSNLRREGALAVAFAVVANLLVWIVAGLLLGEGIQVIEPGSEEASALGVTPVIVASVLPTVVGLAFAGLFARLERSRIAAGVVAVFTLVSLALPFTLEVGAGSQVALATMHLVVGATVATFALRRA